MGTDGGKRAFESGRLAAWRTNQVVGNLANVTMALQGEAIIEPAEAASLPWLLVGR